jgi:hypothetical protein
MWILVGVTARTNLQQATNEANNAFARFPFQLCLPLTVIFTLTSGIAALLHWWSPRRYVLLDFPIAFVICPILAYLAAVSVSVMFLQIRETGVPELAEIAEVIHFPKLGGLLVGLTARFWLWLTLSCPIALVLVAIFRIVLRAVATHREIHTQSRATGGWLGFIIVQFILLLCWIAMSRYMFALPMMAIFRGSGMNYITESVSKARPILRVVFGIAVLEMVVCGLIPSLVRRIVHPRLAGRQPLELLLELILVLASSCFNTWFELLKTALTLQLLSAPQSES